MACVTIACRSAAPEAPSLPVVVDAAAAGDLAPPAWTLRFALPREDERAHSVGRAHSAAEVGVRASELRGEAAELPEGLRQAVEPLIDIMAAVSACEGSFGDVATHSGDPMGSLGIFQWAVARRGAGDPSASLVRFFMQLHKRAEAHDTLATRAWAQLAAAGFGLRGRRLVLDGKPTDGGALERRLAAEWGRGALRTYQLWAAKDWIEDVGATVIRPGVMARLPGYAEREGGRVITLVVGGEALTCRAARVTTVGELLATPRALALAVSLGVHRPHYVETSAWRLLAGEAPASGGCEALAPWLWPALPAAAAEEDALRTRFVEAALRLYPAAARAVVAERLAVAP